MTHATIHPKKTRRAEKTRLSCAVTACVAYPTRIENVPDQLSQVAIRSRNTDDFSVAVIETANPSQLPDPASGS